MAANETIISSAVQYRPGAAPIAAGSLLVRDVAKDIFRKRPQKASLIQIMMGSRRVIDDSRLVEWYEQDLDPRTVTAGAIAGLVVNLTDADATLLFPGSTVGRDISHTYHVTAMVYTTGAATMTLDSVAGLAQGDQLLLGANVKEEYSSEPTPLTRLPVLITNNMFTARDAYGESEWVETQEYYGGKARQRENRDNAMEQHKISLDREAFIGKQPAAQLTLNGNNIMYTDGIFSQIQTNRTALGGGVLTWENLTALAQGYDRLMESGEPYMFVSRTVRPIIDAVAYQKTSPSSFSEVEKKWGLSVQYLQLGDKRYKLITIDHFVANYANIIVCVDPSALTLRSPKDQMNGGLKWMKEYVRGTEITGKDGTIGCIKTDMAVKLENEQGAYIISNVLSA